MATALAELASLDPGNRPVTRLRPADDVIADRTPERTGARTGRPAVLAPDAGDASILVARDLATLLGHGDEPADAADVADPADIPAAVATSERHPGRPRAPRAASAPEVVVEDDRELDAFGPRGEQIEELLDRAAALNGPDIESLGAVSGRLCQGQRYAEALLAMRRAAERSGRIRELGRAGTSAERLVVTIAAARCPHNLEDRARWNVVAAQAAWGAGDAARALVVGDLLPEPQLRALTFAWDTFPSHR